MSLTGFPEAPKVGDIIKDSLAPTGVGGGEVTRGTGHQTNTLGQSIVKDDKVQTRDICWCHTQLHTVGTKKYLLSERMSYSFNSKL